MFLSVPMQLAKGICAIPVWQRASVPTESGEADTSGLRFRAGGMAENRKRLGLTASDFGLLVGATGQSIYAWELGKAKAWPQALAQIAALRCIGKREVEAKLVALKGQ